MSGECLLLIMGYSFSDEHLNEVIFQGLRSNPHLAGIALMYGDASEATGGGSRIVSDEILNLGIEYRNLSIYGPHRACIGGIKAPWSISNDKKAETEDWPFWDKENNLFTLGSFEAFGAYLERFIGFQSIASRSEETITSPMEGQLKEDTGGKIED